MVSNIGDLSADVLDCYILILCTVPLVSCFSLSLRHPSLCGSESVPVIDRLSLHSTLSDLPVQILHPL